MQAFATVQDLTSRWRTLSTEESNRATVLLTDAAYRIVQEGVEVDAEDTDQAYLLKIVSCEMVKRAMLASVDQAPMSNFSQSAGGYSESGTYVNPTGDLYLTKGEKKLLCLRSQRIGSISPKIGEEDD